MSNIGEIIWNQSVPSVELWLAKPDRTLLGKLTQKAAVGFSRFGKRTKMLKHTQLFKLNNVNEIELSIPFEIEINHILVRNPIIDMIRDRYLIKCLYNGSEEWYVITQITNAMDGDKNLKIISARSLQYELINRNVRQLDLVSVNLSTLLNGGNVMDSKGNSFIYGGLLQDTLWNLDSSFDVTFDTIYRLFNISKATVLDVLIQASQTYGAIMLFDTINRKINFKQLINIGQDKGFKISYKNYMKSVENQSDSSVLATRFIPTGQNNLGINSVTANSQNHLDDFTFFIYPFSRDVNKNVLTHSNYMSDNLCNSLLDFSELMNLHKNDFSTLLATLSSQQVILTTKQNDMATLVTGLKSIQANLDVAQTTGQPTTTLLAQQTTQNALIATKQGEINTANANIVTTQASITSLNNLLSSLNNFSVDELTELSFYIFEKTWESPNISDAQSLYDQAIIEFAKWNEPQTIIKVDVVNLLEMVSESRNWDKLSPLSLGDTIQIEYDTIGTNIKAKLVEFSIDHIESNITLTIANVDDLKRDEEKVYRMLYQGIGASNSLSVNTDRWNGIDSASININKIYTDGINSALIAVNSGSGSTTKIDNRGFTSASSTVNTDFIRINNGVCIFSGDGGTTANIAIDKTGIYANKLVGQIILGANLNITNSSGSVTIDGNGMTVTSMNLTLTRSDNNSRILLDSTNGIKIQAKSGGVFVDKFYADGSGNIFANSITLATPQVNGGAIVGSSINIGSGNFTVNGSTGDVYANNGTFRGNILATSGTFSGNITVSGSLNGGSIVGSTIKTSNSFPRLQFDSTDFSQYNLSGTQVIRMSSSFSTPRIDMTDTANLNRLGSFYTYNGMHLQSDNFPLYIDSIGSTVFINSIDVLGSLAGKTNVGSTTNPATVPDAHNHGFSNTDYIQCYDSLGVATVKKQWVAYTGSSAHSHTTT